MNHSLSPHLRIESVSPTQPRVTPWEHGVIWEGVDEIVIHLGDAHWYGGGGLVHQRYPLEKLAIYPAPFITSDNGSTGLLGILEPFWWTSTGAGVLVENDDLQMSFNVPLNGERPIHSFTHPAPFNTRPPLSTEVEGDGKLRISGEGLRLRFFLCDNAREAVEAYWSLLTLSASPPHILLEKPLWTTWAHFKNEVSQEKVNEYLNQLIHYNFTASVFGVDAKWQQQFGDTHFDPQKFPDPSALADRIHQLGAKMTLWSIPFFAEESMHFSEANALGYTVRKKDGTPYIGTWWEGNAAFLDVTNPAAIAWHLDNLTRLAKSVGVDGFKFDAGEAMFFMQPDTVRHDNGAPNRATQHYVEQVSQRFPWSDMRAAWHNQSRAMLFRQWDKTTNWSYANGLASCITQAITISMLGYRFSFPDMIGGNAYAQDHATAELLIRWTQAVAPMPIIQFSLAPWDYGEECALLCQRYAALHTELAPRTIALAQHPVPIVRPLWWLDPTDDSALACSDEYLIGDDLLVAPVIKAGATSRAIYLPQGRWRSYWNPGEVHSGKQWLVDYPAPLDILPLFVRD